MATTQLIPGMYPEIVKRFPKIGGVNNLGVGVDSAGKSYVLKGYADVCIAEFIGAAMCKAIGVRHTIPHVVQEVDLFGQQQFLFGSALEPEVLAFNQGSLADWQAVIAEVDTTKVFTIVLAIDLALGNDDRHAKNWLVETKNPAANRSSHRMIAMDFSNAWPLKHPPHHPLRHPSQNTWDLTRYWEQMGISYDEVGYKSTCAKISSLDSAWLARELAPLIGVWLTQSKFDALCNWWEHNWQVHVINVIAALEPDGEWP